MSSAKFGGSPHKVCPEHGIFDLRLAAIEKRLGKIETSLDAILERLSDGSKNFATTELRVAALEKIAYGAAGIALTGVIGAVLALVFRS